MIHWKEARESRLLKVGIVSRLSCVSPQQSGINTDTRLQDWHNVQWSEDNSSRLLSSHSFNHLVLEETTPFWREWTSSLVVKRNVVLFVHWVTLLITTRNQLMTLVVKEMTGCHGNDIVTSLVAVWCQHIAALIEWLWQIQFTEPTANTLNRLTRALGALSDLSNSGCGLIGNTALGFALCCIGNSNTPFMPWFT